MAKKKVCRRRRCPKGPHEEAPPSETAHHPKVMDQDDHCSSEKLQILKSLNAILVKETAGRRQQVESLECAMTVMEIQLAWFSGQKEALEAELGRAGQESVGLVLEKGIIFTFLKTQMDEMSARMEMSVKQRDAEVGDLSKIVIEQADSLEKERTILRDVSGERDSLKVERAGLVEKANLLKESLSEMEKVRRNLEGSFERLKLQNEKLVKEKEEGERAVEASMKESDSAKNSLAKARVEADKLNSRVEELMRVNKDLEIKKNRKQVKIIELEKEMAVMNEIEVSLRRDEVKLTERVSKLEKICDVAVEKEKEMAWHIDGLVKEKREKEETIEKLKEKNDSTERLLKVAEKELEEKERLLDGIVQKKLEIEEANYCKQNEIVGPA